jgi:uncharacterized protein (TIGR02145 family)
MKKVFLLMLLPAILGAANLSAQVTIGGQPAPDNFSLLDIVTTSIKKGVHLPRLTTAERNDLIPATSADSTKAKGLAVFNTTTNCYDVWNGKQWLSLCDEDMNPLRITTQPAPFTWRRKQDADGDPNGPASPADVTLTVVASGSGTLTYAWYEKPKNKNITTHGTELASTASYTPPITAWGMHTYYCVVSNGTDSVVSTYADVAVGCGAKTNDGNWLSFMCYNLGADTELPPFVYYSKGDTISKDIKGWLFQWGRAADGHQWRGSKNVAGPWNSLSATQVPSSANDYFGKFVTSTSPENHHSWLTPLRAYLWNSAAASGAPCPTGWVVPAISAFSSIFRDGTGALRQPSNATANTWLPVAGGLLILPNGVDTTLFLPFAGRRTYGAGFQSAGTAGSFWTTGLGGVQSPAWDVSAQTAAVWNTGYAWGLSVRCVKQE